ncbi:NAD(P)-dependent alcohol dehydrogenase [bacterium]|nr:NAD(P)-dependent alcohol dehydrogenase [bacterium]
MSIARGFAALNAKAQLAPFSFERREMGDRDVGIDIKYCGICHSDIHQARDEWGGSIFPMVPGHEIAGIVTAVGRKVTKYKPGDKVGVGCYVDSCRMCPECSQGMEQYCSNMTSWTYNGREQDLVTPTYGGYSENIVVDEHFVLRLPDNLPLDGAAPLLCAGITLYSPLRRFHAGPGRRVAIIGLGGLGHIGIKIAHAMGAEVSVISHSTRKQDDARRLGADEFIVSSRDTFSKLSRHFDLIINTVSVDLDWNDFLRMLRVGGTMVILGAPTKPVPIGAFSLISGGKCLAGSGMGGIPETQEMLDFCGKHNIVSDIEKIPIQQVNEAYERVLKSDVRYRFVIDLASL